MLLGGQDIVFDATDFRAWLAAHTPDEVVGYAWMSFSCPVATWLAERYHDAYGVGPDGYVCTGSGHPFERVQAPSWVGAFVSHVDRIYGLVEEEYNPVMASCALEVFDQFCAE